MKLKKNTLAALALSAVVGSGVGLAAAGPVSAQAAQPQYKMYATSIEWNGTVVSQPKHIVAPDPWGGTPTSWLPVWYVYTTLTNLGIKTTWDGNYLNMQAPSSMPVALSNLPSGGTVTDKTLAVQINGKTVLYAPRITANDPANGKPTTYVPIYYLEMAVKRFGVTPGWDGTHWTMSYHSAVVTQKDMANQMWAAFNAAPKWDIVKYATMQDAGVAPTSDAVTAGDVANWLAQWAHASKGMTYAGQFHPYDLQYEASSDPFKWAQINGLYDGTAVSSPDDVITKDEESKIIDNLKWWLNGYKVSNGVYTLHVPFYSNWVQWSAYVGHSPKPIPLSNYQDAIAQATKYYDQIQVWGSPDWSKIYVKLPNTSGTNVTLGVASKNVMYGNANGLDAPGPMHGGTTLTITNGDGNPGVMLSTLTMNETPLGGIGFTVVYRNDTNGVLDLTKPIDFGAEQLDNGQSIN